MNIRNKKSSRSKAGQGIVEYVSCIAFVACLVALAFNLAQGSLFATASQSYSSTGGELNKLNQAVADANSQL